MFNFKPTPKTFEQKVADEAIRQQSEIAQCREELRKQKFAAQDKAAREAAAAIKALHEIQQAERKLQQEIEKAKALANGAVLFKADRPSMRLTKAQADYAGSLARQIRDSGIGESAHSLAKYFSIDRLKAILSEIKAGKTVIIEF